MAQATNDDELERGAAVGAGSGSGSRGGGVALADEGPDELPALLAFAVSIAILTIGLIWPTISGGDDKDDHGGAAAPTEESAAEDDAADDEADAEDAEEEAEEPEEEEPAEDDAAALPDMPTIQGLIDAEAPGITASADGRVVTVSGTVPNETTEQAILAAVDSQPNVDSVIDELEVAAGGEAAVTATAGQVSIVLSGSVPDQATKDAIVAKAIEVYSDEQVVDELVVDDTVGSPALVTLIGAMTDPVLFGQVEAAFTEIDGVELADSSDFTLEESDELEAALNSLDPIQFASGSALVEPESEAILDEAASLLIQNVAVALEIGGHTDSLGGEEANQTLSEARAQAVLDALVERGVGNDLTAVGFGERRLKVSPDEDDPAAQQENRRIEFRIIN